MLYIKTGIVFFSIAFLFACSGKNKDCKQFRTGDFLYNKYSPDSSYLISRNDSTQFETDPEGSFILKQRVRWINACEYELTYISRVPEHPADRSKENQRLIDKIRLIPLRSKIIETGDDYYIFQASKKGVDLVYTDTMWVVKGITGPKSTREKQ